MSYLKWSKVITPSQITSNQNDYAPTGIDKATVVRLSSDNLRYITGIQAPTVSKNLMLVNVGTYPIILTPEDTNSTASNRFTISSLIYIVPYDPVHLIYDTATSRWKVLYYSNDISLSIRHGAYLPLTPDAATPADTWTLSVSPISVGTLVTWPASAGTLSGLALGTGSNATAGYIVRNSLYTTCEYGESNSVIDSIVHFPYLSTGSQRFTAVVGSASAATTLLDQNNTVGFRYRDDISANWQLFSRDNAGTETTVDSGVTITALVMYYLRVEIPKDLSAIYYFINGTFVGKITANLPSTGVGFMSRAAIQKSIGTTERLLVVSSLNHKIFIL